MIPFHLPSRLRRLLPLAAALISGPLLAADAPAGSPSPAPQGDDVETIVCLRHGEKPPGGLGSLDAEGLNRALALPDVLLRLYGKPAYIFAPDPVADQVNEGPPAPDGKHREPVCYVRPLLTIGPTAIRCGMPIEAEFGFKHIAELEMELDKPAYRNALIFLAWEHVQAEQFMRNEVRDHGGDPAAVPVWPKDDFDSLYVAKITRTHTAGARTEFRVDHEGLDGLSSQFPQPAAKKP